LKRVDERGLVEDLCSRLSLEKVMGRDVENLSGGELQRVAIAASIAKDADFYFFDELTPYLDIFQRINVAQLIREISKNRSVLVVEHDLAILDLLADVVYIAYGEPGAYGIITNPKSVRVGINEYLQGYLKEENIRVRSDAIRFEVHVPRPDKEERVLASINYLEKNYDGFNFKMSGGELKNGVLGIMGANGMGKTTFIKMLAGVVKPDVGHVALGLKVSYKPQYIKVAGKEFETVSGLLRSITDNFDSSYYRTELLKPLQLENILDRYLKDLSGGELQRVAIAECLSRDADLFMLDEPSAHLDVEQRALATSLLRRFTENKKAGTLLVDHDIYMIDLASERLMVFSGEPGSRGVAEGPFEMRDGMNRFLREISITFRRDEETHRPRVNKIGSKLDRQQRSAGEYYYPELS
jgi:ATP-binding cassette subfamily E protein 1